jgi:hypothetical protein
VSQRPDTQYFAELALAMGARLGGSERERTLDELEAEIGNLRAAWRHWVEAGDLERLKDLVRQPLGPLRRPRLVSRRR